MSGGCSWPQLTRCLGPERLRHVASAPEGSVVTKKQAEGAQTILIYSCIMQFVLGLVHIGFLLCIRLLKGWLFKTFDTLPFIIKSSLIFTYTSVGFWMQISIAVQQEAFIF